MGDKASIRSSFDIISIGPIGRGSEYATIYRRDDNIMMVTCDYFNGAIDEFHSKVEKTHGHTKHGVSYKALIDFAKASLWTAFE